jgi:hypothetical protein
MTRIIMDHGLACFGTSLAPTDLTLILISARTADISKSFSRFRRRSRISSVAALRWAVGGGRRQRSVIPTCQVAD